MRCALVTAVCSLLLATAASAAPIDSGVLYELNNHPDGSIASPFYGLRLDGLMGDTDDEYTFDFENDMSAMTLLWDETAATIDISGVAFGGEDVGNGYGAGTTALWQIEFRYMNVMDTGDQLRVAEARQPNGMGTITNLTTQEVFQLIDFGDDFTFFLGEGHRDFPGVSGWGWLNHSGAPGGIHEHVYSSDWLFTVGNPVPEPSAGMLVGIGLLASCFATRKRS